MNTPLKYFSQTLSFLFHPLLLPTYAFAMIVWCQPYLFAAYGNAAWVFVLRVFVNTFVFPAICMFLLRRLNFIKSLETDSREERILPYIATGTLYVWTYVTFRKSADPQLLNVVLLGSCIALFGCFLFNIFSKISIHAAGFGCLILVAFANTLMSSFDVRWLLLLVVLLAGVIGSSRIFLQRHTLKEVLTGYMVGVAAQAVAFNFF